MIAQTWGVVPGLSDHTIGPVVPIVATTLGACIFEKHIILDRSHPTADAPFSLTGAEFKDLVQSCRTAKLCIGKTSSAFGKAKQESLSKKWRRSIFAVADIKGTFQYLKTFCLSNV
jgi:sialic acid synthase SpsE